MGDIWLREENGRIRVGVTRSLVEQYKEFLYVEFTKKEGESFKAGEPLVALESLKSIYELSLPFNGRVVETNKSVAEDPSLLNRSPEKTWLIVVERA